jgi:hypothetical protein
MAFTQAELNNIANAALDFYFKGKPFAQSIQDKPLLEAMEGNRKTFPGGKGDIRLNVKGKFAFEGSAPTAGSLKGFTHDDQVNYGTIAGIEQANYPWREMHTGWQVTFTELKKDGISVTDTVTGEGTSKHSSRDMTVISGILDDKLSTFDEIQAKEMNALLWGDGTADAAAMVGIRAYLLATAPASQTGTATGGLNRATLAWWRNRYATWNTASVEIIPEFHKEVRQLRRYGGKPTLALCGSDWLDQLIKELRAKGYYTDSGWSTSGSTDIKIADVRYGSLKFVYDPSLDDLSLPKRCYVIDPTKLYIEAMESEWGKDHAPARPHDVYALYKARTYTGQLVCTQLNAHGVYEFT